MYTESGQTYLGGSGVMGILKQVPEMSLGGGAATGAEILLRLALVSGLGQQPPRDSGDDDQSVISS